MSRRDIIMSHINITVDGIVSEITSMKMELHSVTTEYPGHSEGIRTWVLYTESQVRIEISDRQFIRVTEGQVTLATNFGYGHRSIISSQELAKVGRKLHARLSTLSFSL